MALAAFITLLFPQPYTAWTLQAEVPVPPTVTITHDTRGCAFRACTSYDGTIHVRPDVSRETFLHELGHAFHLSENSAQQEADFADLKGTDTFDPEQFANAYKRCALDPNAGRACSLIRSWGG